MAIERGLQGAMSDIVSAYALPGHTDVQTQPDFKAILQSFEEDLRNITVPEKAAPVRVDYVPLDTNIGRTQEIAALNQRLQKQEQIVAKLKAELNALQTTQPTFELSDGYTDDASTPINGSLALTANDETEADLKFKKDLIRRDQITLAAAKLQAAEASQATLIALIDTYTNENAYRSLQVRYNTLYRGDRRSLQDEKARLNNELFGTPSLDGNSREADGIDSKLRINNDKHKTADTQYNIADNKLKELQKGPTELNGQRNAIASKETELNKYKTDFSETSKALDAIEWKLDTMPITINELRLEKLEGEIASITKIIEDLTSEYKRLSQEDAVGNRQAITSISTQLDTQEQNKEKKENEAAQLMMTLLEIDQAPTTLQQLKQQFDDEFGTLKVTRNNLIAKQSTLSDKKKQLNALIEQLENTELPRLRAKADTLQADIENPDLMSQTAEKVAKHNSETKKLNKEYSELTNRKNEIEDLLKELNTLLTADSTALGLKRDNFKNTQLVPAKNKFEKAKAKFKDTNAAAINAEEALQIMINELDPNAREEEMLARIAELLTENTRLEVAAIAAIAKQQTSDMERLASNQLALSTTRERGQVVRGRIQTALLILTLLFTGLNFFKHDSGDDKTLATEGIIIEDEASEAPAEEATSDETSAPEAPVEEATPASEEPVEEATPEATPPTPETHQRVRRRTTQATPAPRRNRRNLN